MPKVDIVKLQHIADKAWNLSCNIIDSSMRGQYKAYKTSLQEYSSYAVKNFDTVKLIPHVEINLPRFSPEGRNILKVQILDFFRFRTKDERLLKKMIREYRIQQFIDKTIPYPKNKLNPAIIKNIELSKKVMFSSLTGNHKAYVSNVKEYAAFILRNPDMANYSVYDRVRVPVFSREGFNMFKVGFLDKFRRKSKTEKLMQDILETSKANNPAFKIYH